jgi:hypothetical protein
LLCNPWLWIAIAGFALLILRSEAAIFAPFVRDEGAFFTIAQETLHGHVPYRDVFDQKAPAIYYLLAVLLTLTSRLSPTSQLLIARSLAIAVNMLTAWGMVILGRHWWRLGVGLIAALLWLYILPAYQGYFVLTEPFATALTVWAVVVLVKRPGMRGALGAGLLLALSSLFKQTALLALPGIIIILFAQTKPGKAWWLPIRQQITNLVLLATGLLLPWLVTILLFALAGALQPLFSQVVVANIQYPADPIAVRNAYLVAAVKAMPLSFIIPPMVVATGIVRWLDKRGGTRYMPGIGAMACAVLAVCNLAPFYSHAYPHYWLQVEPWTLLLTALGLMAVIDWIRPFIIDVLKQTPSLPSLRLGQRSISLGKPLLLALLGITLLVGSVNIVTSPTHHSGYRVLQEQVAAGFWIDQHMPPGARLLVVPAEPEYYYLSDHLPVTTYIYLLPVNLSPALIAQVLHQIQTKQFDRIVWYQTSDTDAQPANVQVYRQINACYHSIATDDIRAATAPARLVLYAPDSAGAEAHMPDARKYEPC